MEAKERIIVALDVPTGREALELTEKLHPYVGMFKVGSELFTAGGPEVVKEIHKRGGRTFLDLKFHDIPNTVAGASRNAVRLGVAMFNVHCSGGFAMMRAAFEATLEEAEKLGVARPVILGVTVLTSMTKRDFEQEGTAPWPNTPDDFIPTVVGNRSHIAQGAGLDGAVASPLEIAVIRERCGPEFMLVIPGIRPAAAPKDDQERVGTPASAVAAGADYLVIGRPIIKVPDPVAAAKAIAAEITGVVADKET